MKDLDNKDNEIEVIIGDDSELSFSEVEDFVEELKPKTKLDSSQKKNIIIPVSKTKKKDDENK